MTKIKVCCIQNVAEAQMAIDAGVDSIGLVSAMPSGPGVVSDEVIAQVMDFVRGKIEVFLLTSETNAQAIISQYHNLKPDCIQLVDYVSEADYKIIRKEIPEIVLVQVIHVTGQSSIEFARDYSKIANRLLLDSGNPDLKQKILGGTGETHNWSISRSIVESVAIPVYLAGGLFPLNIGEAIAKVDPSGVDICSGLRVEGQLQKSMLIDFVGRVKKGH